MIEMLFTECSLKDHTVEYIDELPQERVEGYLLICKEDVDLSGYPHDNVIDLIQELAKDGDLINNYQAY